MDKKGFGISFDISKRSMNFKDISNKYKKKYNQSTIIDIEGEIWKPIKGYENIYIYMLYLIKVELKILFLII